AEVLHPLRRVREADDAVAGSTRLEEEHGGVGAVQEAACDHATRRPGADDHVVVALGEHMAGRRHQPKICIFGLSMKLHDVCAHVCLLRSLPASIVCLRPHSESDQYRLPRAAMLCRHNGVQRWNCDICATFWWSAKC